MADRESSPTQAAGTVHGTAAALLVAANRISQRLEGELRERQLASTEALLLVTLATVGPLTMRRIAEELAVRPSSATSFVNRMETRGLVERRTNPQDARSVLVDLTAVGEDAATAASGAFTYLDAELDAGPGTFPGTSHT